MTTTILCNHSLLGDDDLDLSKLIVASFMLLQWYLFLTWCDYRKGELPYGHRPTSVENNVYELTYGGAHVYCKAYQGKWLRLRLAFNKLVKILLAITKYKYIPTQLNSWSQ
jgi:hypothetical protein